MPRQVHLWGHLALLSAHSSLSTQQAGLACRTLEYPSHPGPEDNQQTPEIKLNDATLLLIKCLHRKHAWIVFKAASALYSSNCVFSLQFSSFNLYKEEQKETLGSYHGTFLFPWWCSYLTWLLQNVQPLFCHRQFWVHLAKSPVHSGSLHHVSVRMVSPGS